MKKALWIVAAALTALLIWQLTRLISGRRPGREASVAESHQSVIIDDAPSMTEIADTALISNHPVIGQANDSLRLGMLAQDTTTLFCRYSLMGCKPCIDNAMTQITRYGELHPDIRIILLLRDISKRDLYVNQKEIGDRLELYLCDELPLDVEDGSYPYFFRLSSEGKIKDLFETEYGNHALTSEYLFNLQ